LQYKQHQTPAFVCAWTKQTGQNKAERTARCLTAQRPQVTWRLKKGCRDLFPHRAWY